MTACCSAVVRKAWRLTAEAWAGLWRAVVAPAANKKDAALQAPVAEVSEHNWASMEVEGVPEHNSLHR